MSTAYRLTGRIEAGDLAELYEAVQEPGGPRVIIKLFHPKTSDPRYATTLAGVYSVLNPLNPEGVVPVLDMGFVKQRLAVVREAVDGHTLGTALHRLNTKEVLLPPATALWLIIQLLESVERAHAAGGIHGSITPGNVLLSRGGLPSVCDFGALQALLAVPELKRAFAGRGRSAYRAPEVGRGEPPDVLSDIYSIGAIAYELLTLREAVIPDGGVSTRRAGLPPPSRLDRRLHARLDPIILRALEAT
ncbi:MAG TPA: protein kinase, partial [Archangium sp.]|nr:protein kinase [Archangium sp.]